MIHTYSGGRRVLRCSIDGLGGRSVNNTVEQPLDGDEKVSCVYLKDIFGRLCFKYARTRSRSELDVQLPFPRRTCSPGSPATGGAPDDRPSAERSDAAVRRVVLAVGPTLGSAGEAAAGAAAAGAVLDP